MIINAYDCLSCNPLTLSSSRLDSALNRQKLIDSLSNLKTGLLEIKTLSTILQKINQVR